MLGASVIIRLSQYLQLRLAVLDGCLQGAPCRRPGTCRDCTMHLPPRGASGSQKISVQEYDTSYITPAMHRGTAVTLAGVLHARDLAQRNRPQTPRVLCSTASNMMQVSRIVRLAPSYCEFYTLCHHYTVEQEVKQLAFTISPLCLSVTLAVRARCRVA